MQRPVHTNLFNHAKTTVTSATTSIATSTATSAPDILLKYNQNQDRWQEFSASVKAQLLAQLPGYPENSTGLNKAIFPFSYETSKLLKTSLMCAYAFLAIKRQEIAAELSHGKNDSTDRSSWYGEFRKEGFECYETVCATNEKIWPNQKEQIFRHVQALIDAANTVMPKANIDYHAPNYQPLSLDELEESLKQSAIYKLDDYIIWRQATKEYYLNTEKNDPRHPVIKYHITFKSPIKEVKVDGAYHSTNTIAIIYHDYPEDSSKNWISLQYVGINNNNMIGDCKLGERYFQACRKSTDRQEFLLNAGRLAHLMAQLLWVKLGNAAITEWLIETLAQEKGFELDLRKCNDDLSWDWKALLTPNREDYAKWYADKQELKSHLTCPPRPR